MFWKDRASEKWSAAAYVTDEEAGPTAGGPAVVPGKGALKTSPAKTYHEEASADGRLSQQKRIFL